MQKRSVYEGYWIVSMNSLVSWFYVITNEGLRTGNILSEECYKDWFFAVMNSYRTDNLFENYHKLWLKQVTRFSEIDNYIFWEILNGKLPLELKYITDLQT
jgi:hypothetical protein